MRIVLRPFEVGHTRTGRSVWLRVALALILTAGLLVACTDVTITSGPTTLPPTTRLLATATVAASVPTPVSVLSSSARPALTASPTAALTPGTLQSIASGGIGLNRADWEKQHTQSVASSGVGAKSRGNYDDGFYSVQFTETDLTYYIRVALSQSNRYTTMESVKRLGLSLLPADVTFDYVNVNDDDVRMEIYSSQTLKAQFEAFKKTNPQLQWPGGQAGKVGQVALYFRENPTTQVLEGLDATTTVDRQAT